VTFTSGDMRDVVNTGGLGGNMPYGVSPRWVAEEPLSETVPDFAAGGPENWVEPC
jgi:hypothetical protein